MQQPQPTVIKIYHYNPDENGDVHFFTLNIDGADKSSSFECYILDEARSMTPGLHVTLTNGKCEIIMTPVRVLLLLM